MPRNPAPWFWDQLQEWCVRIDNKRHRLGKNPEGAPTPSKNKKGKWIVPDEISKAFHLLRAGEKKKEVPSDSVKAIVDLFLDWTKTHRAPLTHLWYLGHLQSFVDSLTPATLAVDRLKSHHIDTWIDSHDWGPSTRRGAMTAVARCMNWAAKKDRIAHNPIYRKLDKPAASKREVVLSAKDFAAILKHTSGEFRELIETVWETGCRPEEIVKVEARHVELKNERWKFPIDESKGKKKSRIVYLSDKALKLTKRLMAEHPTGPLFRKPNGTPWHRYDVSQYFQRLEPKLGVQYRLYDMRHSFITNGLRNGVDPVTMANLVGHVDLKMIHEIYNHTSLDTTFMKTAAKKAIGRA
jgi:integrase